MDAIWWLDNLIVAQKDNLLNLLTECLMHIECNQYEVKCIDGVKQVLNILQFNSRFWIEYEYGYKGKEIVDRILSACQNSKNNLHHKASVKREQLNGLIQQCELLLSCYKNQTPVVLTSEVKEETCQTQDN